MFLKQDLQYIYISIKFSTMSLTAILIILAINLGELTAQTTTIVNATKSYVSVPPVWLTSSYFRAGNQAVINTLTGNDKTPTFTFTFSSPLTAPPELAYGIKNYRGNDYYWQECYEIRKIGLTRSTFSVSIQIYGTTNIWLLTVAYLAVEPSFPHHFNTFENVPLNYSSGDIVNISSKNPSSLTYFTQYINYTSQAASKTYNTFTSPLSSNTIVLFMTSLWIVGSGQHVKFHIYSQVINSSIYMWNATLQLNVMVTNVHFSQVIFNKDDIVSSNKYQVVYEIWDNDMEGGWIAIPYQFVDNFIMGVTAFQAVRTHCGFEYQWEFTNSSGVFGVQLLRSWTITNTCGFSWSRTSILYIRTWLCNPPYIYFNITTLMCQDFCGAYYIENATSALCQFCSNFMCYQCNSNGICIDCGQNMELLNGTCVCTTGYFYLQGKCVTCASSNPGCLNCTYGILSQTLAFNVSIFQCYNCNETQDYFNVNGSCVACSLPHCVNCSSLTQCSQCSSGYSIQPVFFNCSYCLVVGCLECLPSNNGACKVCYNAIGYYLDNSTNQCINKCGDGLTVTGLEPCDDGNTFDGDGCSSTCQFQPYFNCTLLANLTTVCIGICGDGYLYGRQEGCDDGNTINSDGCSSDCKLELKINLIRQQRVMASCNHLQFWFKVSPYYSFVDTLDFASTIVINSSALINPSFLYRKSTLSLSYDFTEDMTLRNVQLYQNSTMMLMHPNYTFYIASPNFTIKPNNNVAANFLDQKQCEDKQFYRKAFKAVQVISFITLFISMIPGKIIGLQLFGVLQLAYFSVGSIDSVNVLLYPLMSMKQLNGYSTPVVGSSSDKLPQRVQQIKYYPSFLDNFNVMFLLLIVEFTTGIVLYFVNKLIKNTRVNKFASKLLKQFFLTLILFNCFNIAYASGIFFKFGTQGHGNLSFFAAVISLFALFAMAIAVVFVHPDGFGEFKEKFKKDIVSSAYMSVSIIYRSIVGFLLAYSNDDDLSTLFTLGCSLMFLIYNLVNLPFSKAYHNYRACLCHFTQFITIFVAMYYRSMKSTTAPSEVAVIYSPAKLQFGVIITTLLVSVLVLIYDSYLFVKELSCLNSNQKVKENDCSNNEIIGQVRDHKKIGQINDGKSEIMISQINNSENHIDEGISYIQITPK